MRAAIARAGGHATLVARRMRCAPTVPVFEPADGALAALTATDQAGFDPGGMLNPGRMCEESLDRHADQLFTRRSSPIRTSAESEKILRTCVHCGFCTATCPTYVLLGDELDSPRGRIYLIKDMLENDRPATAEVVKHVDRCLSCLSCMTTCPSGVELHASGRSRATPHRADLSPPVDGPD